jgi:hypothetical protein
MCVSASVYVCVHMCVFEILHVYIGVVPSAGVLA